MAVWVRKGGEWAIIHRCKRCGKLSSNRVAADDNPMKLMSIAMKPLCEPPFPLERIEERTAPLPCFLRNFPFTNSDNVVY